MSNHTNKFLLLIAFISGMSIMAMEISASRLIAPYFGSTIFVWTNIIGIVLIALSLGYYFGGKYSDRHPKINSLLFPILIAGVIFLAIPYIIKPLANVITINAYELSSASVLTFIGSFILTLILFAFPLFLLGMVSPYVIRLYKTDKSHLGETAGSIFAVSTMGSILGTFLPTLFFIPTIGTRLTITIFASLLILMSLIGLLRGKLKFLALFVIIFPILSTQSSAIKADHDLIYETESPYQYIQVLQDKRNIRYLVYNEGGGVQSMYDPKKILNDYYYDYFLPLIYFNDQKDLQEISIIGLAGGTLSRQLHHFFEGQIHIDGVEIDQKVIDIAKKYFDIENDSLTIHNQDGYIFLKYNQKLYDFIVIDAYSQELYIPWTMTTQEFWQTVQESLHPNGLTAINVNAISEDSELLQAITNTMASVFPNTYLTKVSINPNEWNFMIISSKTPLDFDALPSKIQNPELKSLTKTISGNIKKYQYNPQNLILTNDRAPIEMMTDSMIYEYIKTNYAD